MMCRNPSFTESPLWRVTVLSPHRWLFFILLLVSLNALYQYLGAGRDDVFITLWAGKTLGTAPWFINYNGELQEISSSILGALTAKLAYLCCADTYYLANKLFGAAAALATLAVIWLQRRAFFHHPFPSACAIAAIALLGFNPSFAYWSLGGLETPYYALLILLYAALAIRLVSDQESNPFFISLVQMLALLCRPEGFWLIGVTATLLAFYWPQLHHRQRIFLGAILPPLLALIALFALRYALTDALFPNPVYAKVSVRHLGGLQEGWNYLTGFYTTGLAGLLFGSATVSAAALISYAAIQRFLPSAGQAARRLDSRWLVPALGICAYEVFIVLVKGDWMEYHRFLAPTLALKAVLLIQIGATGLTLTPKSARRGGAIAATLVLLLAVIDEWRYRSPQDCSTRLSRETLVRFLDHPNDATIALNCAHQRDGYAIRPFIDRELSGYLAQQGHLTIVTYQGGYFPYFLREQFSPRDITLVDTTGLLNLEIARVEGEKIPTGNKYLDDIPAILSGGVPGLSEKVSRYNPNMIYLLGDSDADQARLKAIGFERIHQAPSGVVYLKTGGSVHPLHDSEQSR